MKNLVWERAAHMQYESNPPMERARHPRPFGSGLSAYTEAAAEVVIVIAASEPALSPVLERSEGLPKR